MPTRTRVLVLPGYATSDTSTQLIRASLAGRGHRPHGWRLGRNVGPTEHTTRDLGERLRELYDRDGKPVALVGWSLGGLYAHWIAAASPHLVHSVVTLGSPLNRVSGRRPSLRVPTTSVYSKNDRVVPWEMSLVDTTVPRHQNVEVRTGHIGLGFDPAVLHLIGDRVSQDPREWKPFKAPLLMRPAFPST